MSTEMICPRCGSEMNHHADKLVYGEPATEAAAGALGEMIKEFHTCAQCGSSAMRSATEGSQQL